MKKISLILCIVLCMSALSCAVPYGDPTGAETTKAVTPTSSTPEVTPEAITPIESTPEVTPEITTPTESIPETTPSEETPAESTTENTPETTTPGVSSTSESTETIPNISETTDFYHYEKLPDASKELSAELMEEIEELVGAEIDWEEHYLGTFKDYVLFGVMEETEAQYVQYYTRKDLCFGFFTELYGYKDGEIYTFRELLDSKVYDLEQIFYISYMGTKKAVGELPDLSKEVSAETVQIIKDKYKYFDQHYYGTYNGYVVFGDGEETMEMVYTTGLKKLVTYSFRRTGNVYVYSPEIGFLELASAFSDDLIDIEYENVVRAVMVSCLRDIPEWVYPNTLPES